MTATKTAATKTAATKTSTKTSTKTAKAAPIVITAPKGGDQTVAPRQGAIRAAVEASGKSLTAISREHGLNPSQMRRLALDQVAKVDSVRAEAIALALGADLSTLFEAPVDKARAARPEAG
jgi:lambda repressor-like predicted transcriptional regulator